MTERTNRTVFFRDDDLGWDDERFLQLLDLFIAFDCKLNAAAIPREFVGRGCPRALLGQGRHLEVHTHGFQHSNYELAGKKAEFGPSRTSERVWEELCEARAVIESVFGPLSFPAFTPPWNRMEESFLPLLPKAGYEVLSRDGPPRQSAEILEINVSVDLHTERRRPARTTGELLKAILGASSGLIGVMLHHGKMAEQDFGQLRELLQAVRDGGVDTRFFSEIHAGDRSADGKPVCRMG